MGIHNDPAWRQAINHILHFSFALKAEIESRLNDELSIGLADHEGLINIRFEKDELKMSDLADRLVLSRGGVTKLVDRLEAAGYVRRMPSADDRRVTIIEITEAGLDLVTRSRQIIDEIATESWGKTISDDESMQVVDMIRRAYQGKDPTLVDEDAEA